jgi:hypothetical protein
MCTIMQSIMRSIQVLKICVLPFSPLVEQSYSCSTVDIFICLHLFTFTRKSGRKQRAAHIVLTTVLNKPRER